MVCARLGVRPPFIVCILINPSISTFNHITILTINTTHSIILYSNLNTIELFFIADLITSFEEPVKLMAMNSL